MKKAIEFLMYLCLRCNHSWHPKINKVPTVCPKCKSPYWSIPRKPKEGDNVKS